MKQLKTQLKQERPQRQRVTREEALARMESFPKRREKMIAAIRKY